MSTARAARAAREPEGFAFESTLGKIARVITGRYGVSVAFSPDGPRVEQGRIVIPDRAADEALEKDVLVGYLDLLAARAKHSSLDALAAQPPGVTAELAQVIEDRRVARLLIESYPGARWFLGALRAHAARQAEQRWPRLHWRARLVWRIERALWNEAPTAIEAQSYSLTAALHAASELIDAARTSRSSRESIERAQAIVARVRALSAGGANNMMFTTQTAEDIETDRAAATFESFDDTFALEAPLAADGTQAEFTERASADSSREAVGMGRSPLGAAALDEAGEAGDMAGRAPRSRTAGTRPQLSIPLATEFDVETDLTGAGESAAWRALRQAARAQTAPLKDRLERALSADERVRWRREQERGEIDRAALAKLATSPGYRTPFRTLRATKGRDVAITLLLDRSGSMAGRKIELARLCVAALADALTQLSFECEVLGYSSVDCAPMQALLERQRAAGADLSRYNRFVERLDLKIYKRFGSPDLAGLACIDCGYENPDGEALAWAAARLAEQRAARRILMVFSDGYPSTGDGDPQVLRSDLRARVAAIGSRGIELVGVGILTDAVESFYPHNIVVSRLAELPSTVLGVLSRMLLDR
ncbi:cobaltochelatase CobT-related protein [Trinickia fusca]|uniref:Cobalamin biosynthesis protein CobT n=1 Tax=Trinickia fusca TaxID=2419777 RepID=A0A494XML8_9BURK|nr:cobalamin biosynthesis protein CobT [Trinickia fusca]RKP51002.1 cobalamin biosynthesis protein CobT [Trinickia fusca]